MGTCTSAQRVHIDSNEDLTAIIERFSIKPKKLNRLWRVFKKLDVEDVGYINLDQLFDLIKERPTSIIAPYLERFFYLTPKKNPELISFEEWIPATYMFCLLTREAMYQFVFNLLDKDRDGMISKVCYL